MGRHQPDPKRRPLLRAIVAAIALMGLVYLAMWGLIMALGAGEAENDHSNPPITLNQPTRKPTPVVVPTPPLVQWTRVQPHPALTTPTVTATSTTTQIATETAVRPGPTVTETRRYAVPGPTQYSDPEVVYCYETKSGYRDRDGRACPQPDGVQSDSTSTASADEG